MVSKAALIAMVAVLFTAITSGCSTPYQPSGFRGGYSETKLGPDEAIVRFEGNGYTSREQVFDKAMFRAAELTVASGFSTFTILSGDVATDTSHQVVNYGFGPYSQPQVQSISRHEQVLHIRMFRDGQSPERAYNAREIQATIGPKIGR